MPPRNLVNLHVASKGYGSRSVLRDVTLGLNEGERVGIVGENGAGKSTLMRLLAGAESPDQGTAPLATRLNPVLGRQCVSLAPARTDGQELVGCRPGYEWPSDARIREVLEGRLDSVAVSRFAQGLSTAT